MSNVQSIGKKCSVVFTIYVSTILFSYAQDPQMQVLTERDFISQVKQYHPVAKQANIAVEKADGALLSAKGNFDPAIAFEASRKTFDGKNYYFYNNPELNVPLPVGNIKTGIENNGGDYITSEITKGKTSYLGLEIPLANGLLLDKRRAALQQAKLFRSQSEQERLVILNDLFFNSYLAYWNWAASYQQYIAYSKFTEIASNRLRLIRIAFTQGDRALVDTVEAYTQLQTYQLMQSEALLKLTNAKLELGNYLWFENYSSYQLPDNFLPESLNFAPAVTNQHAEELIAQSILQHPVLKVYDFKLSSLEVERKLKRQSLLPYLSVKANLLNKDYYALKNLSTNFIQNNYRWGIDFKIPLFLRQARGDYKNAQLKIKETNLELNNKRRQTENKIHSYYNELIALASQLQTAQSMFNNYQSLLRSEELKFAQGESSLFLVNTREIKVIESEQKRLELVSKWYKAKYALEWAAGKLF
ncbi:MAG: multidrug efflux protein outer rane component [Ferruginibacter sp.]|uniref:TolC family protein n=1 Tax=Ferruginibacter sp. TaxID=1940288 RepID=UPI002659D87E|nr:TolC family protein [Ferruginibacter sp.]MDB5276410.1 multidrug efflux protein outer rane component [Ferruginibacter sp.]